MRFPGRQTTGTARRSSRANHGRPARGESSRTTGSTDRPRGSSPRPSCTGTARTRSSRTGTAKASRDSLSLSDLRPGGACSDCEPTPVELLAQARARPERNLRAHSCLCGPQGLDSSRQGRGSNRGGRRRERPFTEPEPRGALRDPVAGVPAHPAPDAGHLTQEHTDPRPAHLSVLQQAIRTGRTDTGPRRAPLEGRKQHLGEPCRLLSPMQQSQGRQASSGSLHESPSATQTVQPAHQPKPHAPDGRSAGRLAKVPVLLTTSACPAQKRWRRTATGTCAAQRSAAVRGCPILV